MIKQASLTLQSLLFVLFVFFLSGLLYIRDIGGLDIDKFLLLGIVVVYALLADYTHLIMLTAFVLPLTIGLPGNYILPILCALILIKGGKRMRVPNIIWSVVLLISIYELIHIFIFASSFEIPTFVGYCSFLFLSFFIGCSSDARSDEYKNALSFCIGTVVMLVIIMINFQQLLGENFLEESIRMGNVSAYTNEEKMTLKTNPNNIGLFSIAAISISFALWYYKKIRLLALALIVIPSFVCGVYSVSRTWILAVMLFGILFLLMRDSRRRFVSILVLLIAILGIYFFFTRFGSLAFDSFEYRFDTDNTEMTGKRTLLFYLYNEWLLLNPWAFLTGTGALPYREVTQVYESTHNSLQQIIVAYGIPGLLFFFYLLYLFLRKWRVPKQRMVYVPIIVVCFFLQTVQFLNPYFCAYPFLASLFVIKMKKKDSLSANTN